MSRKEAAVVLLIVIISIVLSHHITSSYYYFLLRSLEEEHIDLKARISRLHEVSKKLNESLNQAVSLLQTYCCLPYVFPAVLNEDELLALKWYVVQLGLDPKDEWFSLERIYSWVQKNIAYIKDPKIVVPGHRIVCIIFNGERYCVYEFRELKDYVQSPTETIRRGGGDCEDHAILVYALLYYYFRYIRGVNYTIWFAFMSFRDGSKHASVFIPVKGSRLLIVDTSIAYITSADGKILPKFIGEELERYSRLFAENGGIERINLYTVNIENKSYSLLVSGGLKTIEAYIERYTRDHPDQVLEFSE